MEIDIDTYEKQLREADFTIQDLEQKLESNLEQLALVQWELEEYKMHTQEQMERLAQQKREIESELFAKDAELKKMRIAQSARNSLLQGGSASRRHTVTRVEESVEKAEDEMFERANSNNLEDN